MTREIRSILELVEFGQIPTKIAKKLIGRQPGKIAPVSFIIYLFCPLKVPEESHLCLPAWNMRRHSNKWLSRGEEKTSFTETVLLCGSVWPCGFPGDCDMHPCVLARFLIGSAASGFAIRDPKIVPFDLVFTWE